MEAMTPSEEVINGSSQTIADPLVFEPDTLALSNPRQPFCLFHCVPSPDFEDSVCKQEWAHETLGGVDFANTSLETQG